jgi:GT2 family glycosyltransferase
MSGNVNSNSHKRVYYAFKREINNVILGSKHLPFGSLSIYLYVRKLVWWYKIGYCLNQIFFLSLVRDIVVYGGFRLPIVTAISSNQSQPHKTDQTVLICLICFI